MPQIPTFQKPLSSEEVPQARKLHQFGLLGGDAYREAIGALGGGILDDQLARLNAILEAFAEKRKNILNDRGRAAEERQSALAEAAANAQREVESVAEAKRPAIETFIQRGEAAAPGLQRAVQYNTNVALRAIQTMR